MASPLSLRSLLHAKHTNSPSIPVNAYRFSAGSCYAVPHRAKLHSSTAAATLCFWSSSSSYVSLRAGAPQLCGKPIAVKRLSPKRRVNEDGFVRCATMEEIEAEKSSIEQDAKVRMEKTIETLRTNFNSVRTGRANPSMLDKIQVEYYGSPVSLKSIAQISTPDASSILVQPYDKSSLKAVEKAIVNSDLGLTPNNDGEVIRLSVPQLTSDRRKELSKVVAKMAEEGKVL
ncbi:unnamed protein product [Linum tenue]|uniref:Ribosome-recycling factor, chloroplastic n=1 Tax=Linum tenue TaxID=586396 RepID=A0AAV0IUQ1_9ROSI|nr:unnamed protein product [Linum tenue]